MSLKDTNVASNRKETDLIFRSPGYGLMLVAETTTHVQFAAEMLGQRGQVPEDVGKQVALQLLQQIEWGGCIDVSKQWFVLLFMVLCPEDISRIRFGKLTDHS